MSDFARGLILGSNIFSSSDENDSSLREQNAQLQAALRAAEEQNRESAAIIAGKNALGKTLLEALHDVNPENPLVSPFEKSENSLRKQIFFDEYNRAIASPGSTGPKGF